MLVKVLHNRKVTERRSTYVLTVTNRLPYSNLVRTSAIMSPVDLYSMRTSLSSTVRSWPVPSWISCLERWFLHVSRRKIGNANKFGIYYVGDG